MSRPGHAWRLLTPRLLPALGLAVVAASALWAQPGLDAPLTVSGTLVDERGVAAANVEVLLRPYPSAFELDLQLLGYEALPGAVDSTRSGPDGSFSLSAPVPGPYRFEIRATAPPDPPGVVMPLVYGILAPLNVSRVLEPNALPDRHRVAVHVLDADDQPIEAALVVATPTTQRSARYERTPSNEQPKRLYPRFHRAAARTDTTGVARFLMPTAEAHVVASAPGFTVSRTKTESGRAAFRLERDPGIRFRVRDPDGTPAPGVVIRTRGEVSVPLAVTAEDGETLVPRFVDSETTFELERADHAFNRTSPTMPVATHPSTGEQVLDVRLAAPLRIPGRVVDAEAGIPIDSATVWVSSYPGHATSSDGSGIFELSTWPARDAVNLSVNAHGYVSAQVEAPATERGGPTEVSIRLKPAAPLSGLVTDGADQPIAGASIRAERRGIRSLTGRITHRPQRTTSAPDGSFRLADLRYGSPYRFTVQAEGFASTVLDVPPFERGVTANPVRIVLTKGRRARGTVVDTEGSPVAGAEVTLRWPKENESPFYFNRLDAAEPTATDERGEFSFPAVTAGEYDVGVTHAEYVSTGSATTDVPQGEGDIDLGAFTLVPGAQIDGLVTDPDGQPVSGATVEAERFGPDRDQERTTTTDADGRFRLTGLPHQLVDLTVRADGYPPRTLRGTRPETGETILIELQAGASLAGRVVDDAGKPAAGASVQLHPDFESLTQGTLPSSRDYYKRTDGDGRFRFNDVGAGTWSLEATEGTAKAKLDAIELAPGTEPEVELRLRSQDQLIVLVTTHLGEPVSEARIRVAAEADPYSGDYGTTDASSRAQIGITPGAATVSIEHVEQQDESRQVVLEPGDNELAFQLQPGGAISGTVRSPDGAPLAVVTVEAHQEGDLDMPPAAYRRYFGQPKTTSGRDGQFRLAGLEPGRYLLTARASGLAGSGPAQPIEIDGQAVDGVDIVLEPGGSITGTVTGLSAAELGQVEIAVSQNAGWQVTAPDAEGSFGLENLAPGTWKIVARKGEFYAERSVERSVTLERGGTEAFVELPFERGLSLSGQVLIAGEPLTDGFLSVDQPEEADPHWTQTDHRGAFVMDGLAPGSYELQIQQPGGSTEHRSIDLQTDLDGLRIDLQAPTTLTGVVLDRATGQPLANVSLTAGNAARIAALRAESARLGAAGWALSGAGGRFALQFGSTAEQLWITRDGYQGALLSLSVAPGQHQSGIVIELQPATSEPPNP